MQMEHLRRTGSWNVVFLALILPLLWISPLFARDDLLPFDHRHKCGVEPYCYSIPSIRRGHSHNRKQVRGACYVAPSIRNANYKDYCCCNPYLSVADWVEGVDRTVNQDIREYCEYLASDDPNGWMFPFRGQHPNMSKLPEHYDDKDPAKFIAQDNFRCVADNFCYKKTTKKIPIHASLPNMYRFAPAYEVWDQHQTDEFMREITNKLRFTKSTMAQEGLSFCLVGRHLKRSPLQLSEPLKGFGPLIEKSLDIGNHVDPDDANKMNRFDLPEGAKIKLKDRRTHHNSGTTNFTSIKRLPTHEYENVYLGAIKNPMCKQYVAHYGTSDGQDKTGPLARWDDIVFKLESGFTKRPAHPHFMPHKNCKNPYKVHVTQIEADGLPMQNYLHIKVYAEAVDNPRDPYARCPTGKIKYLMLEVRDQDGYTVGQFTDDIPCDQDEATLNAKPDCPSGAKCRRWTGTRKNHMPCMFTHPDAIVHPSIFMMAATSAGTSGGSGPSSSSKTSGSDETPDFCRFSWKADLKPPKIKFKENANQYFTEVHATWRFAQMNPRWITELHFATLIVEDETPIQYYTSRKTLWVGPQVPYPFGCGGTCKGDENDHYPVEQPESKKPDFEFGTGPGTKCCSFFGTQYTNHDEVLCSLFELGLINRCVNSSHHTNRPYGYSAKYFAIKPTFKTLGGWDPFLKQYILPEDVNCHVDITYSPEGHYELKEDQPGKLSKLPIRSSLWDYLAYTYKLENRPRYTRRPGAIKYKPPNYKERDQVKGIGNLDDWGKFRYCTAGVVPTSNPEKINIYELGDWHTPGVSRNTNKDEKTQMLMWFYYGKKPEDGAKKMFRSAHQDPIVLKTEFPDEPLREYFGSQELLSPYVPQGFRKAELKLQGPHGLDQKQTMKEIGLDPKMRCPCPYIPTTAPPELQTKTDKELDGRQTHVINMMIAWMILVPLAFFVIRFYKETFSKVFFLQEYWWYTIHFLSLITALVFMLGGLYGMHLKRKKENYEIVWTDATRYHIYGGYIVIVIYVIHLCLGSLRAYNLQVRLIQFALHWGIGWFEYAMAATVILAAVAIPSGTMNCYSFGIYCGFLVFHVGMTLFMEYHMHFVSDPLLHLIPPRQYLPSPMIRVFHKDAPYSRFRVIMLVVFFLGCVTFYFALHATLEFSGAETSCFQPVAEEKSESIV